MDGTTFIYALTEPITNEVRYIGKSNNPRRRYSTHTTSHHYQVHKSHWIKKLQSQGMKPTLIILEEVPVSDWQERERYWIRYYREHGANLINETEGGGGMTTLTPEHIENMRIANTGKKRTPEQRQRIAEAAQERSLNPEWREKMSEVAKGRKHTPETIAKLSEIKRAQAQTPEGMARLEAMRNKSPSTQSPETGAKKSKAMREKYEAGWDIGEEARAKISKAKKGIPRTPETIAKMSAANMGKKRGPMSEEQKAKLSAAAKGKPKPWLSASQKGKPTNRPRCPICKRFLRSDDSCSRCSS